MNRTARRSLIPLLSVISLISSYTSIASQEHEKSLRKIITINSHAKNKDKEVAQSEEEERRAIALDFTEVAVGTSTNGTTRFHPKAKTSSKGGKKNTISSINEKFFDTIKSGIAERDKKITAMLKAYPADKGVTILLGTTGAGKTTIICHALGEELKSVKQRKKYFIVENTLKSNDDPTKIGCSYGAQTRSPYMRDEWIDCPGLFDTQGPDSEILNAYSIAKVVQLAPKLRFLITITEAQMSVAASRGEVFVSLIKELSTMFEDYPIEELKKSLNLIVTQGDFENIAQIKQIIKAIAEVRKNELTTPYQTELLNFFTSDDNNQITFFNMPESEEVLPCQPALNFINGSGYITGLKPNITYKSDVKIYLKKFSELISDEIKEILKKFNENIQRYSLQILKNNNKQASEVRSEIKEILNTLEQIKFSRERFTHDIEIILEFVNKFQPKIKNKLLKLADQGKILFQITPSRMNLNIELNKEGVFNNIKESLRDISMDPTPKDHGDKFTLDGYIVGLSDLAIAIGKKSDLSTICCYSKLGLLFDQAFSYPGSNLIIGAPYWFLKKPISINLSGVDAKSRKRNKAQNGLSYGDAGKDGKPGKPGQSGGNFYGLVDKVYGQGELKIDVSSGKGGKGQQGGDGQKGKAGKQGNKKKLENRKAIKVSEKDHKRNRFVALLTPRKAYKIKYRSGEQPGSGGNAGRGGAGGKGGQLGSCEFYKFSEFRQEKFNLTQLNNIKCLQKKGQRGTPGLVGKVGDAGDYFSVFEGVYIRKGKASTLKCITNSLKFGVMSGTVGGGTLIGLTGTLGAFLGPIGISASLMAGTLVGTFGGGIIGVGTSAIGTVIDKKGGWQIKCHEVPTSATKGKKPDHKDLNKEGIKAPKINALTPKQIYDTYKNL